MEILHSPRFFPCLLILGLGLLIAYLGSTAISHTAASVGQVVTGIPGQE